MVHEDYKELLALQALDALEETDRPELTGHLSTCAECRAELDELRDLSGFLAYAATEAEPPVELRSRILESVRAEKSSTGAAESSFERQPRSNVVSLTASPRRSFVQRFGAIAAAVAFIALLGSLYVLWNRNKALQTEIATLSEQARVQQQEAERQRAAMEFLTGPEATRLELAGTPVARKAHAMLAFDRNTGHAMLMVEGLPAPPADKAYQLWFIAGGRPMPGKVFTIDSSGKAMMSDEVPAEARQKAVFAVTLEPREGVRAPTGQMYLVSAVS
ncbi:MAG: anti-sigma factor [Pyrinomonadaceae bacterium]